MQFKIQGHPRAETQTQEETWAGCNLGVHGLAVELVGARRLALVRWKGNLAYNTRIANLSNGECRKEGHTQDSECQSVRFTPGG